MQPNSDVFPDFDDNLRQAFKRETELFFESVMREDRSVLDLLTADYTFVNERLARHYGIPNVYGSRFRRVTVTDDARRGLLGQGSILAVTSHAERTSPVVRGKWILENILGTPPPPPPIPTCRPFEETAAGRRSRGRCASRWRSTARTRSARAATRSWIRSASRSRTSTPSARGGPRTPATPIDASGELVDGTQGRRRRDAAEGAARRIPTCSSRTMTEKLLTYALGRGLDARDMPAVRAIVREAPRDDYRFSSLVLGIVHSTPFTMRVSRGRRQPDVGPARRP